MAFIKITNLTLDLPILDVNQRSFKKNILNKITSGKISTGLDNKIHVRALDNINLHINDGDRVGILGPNGSGKSTLLRVIAGIYEPSIGSVKVEGSISSMLSIFLGMDLDATGLENIYLRGAVMGLSNSDVGELIQSVIDFSGLKEFLYLPMRSYSTGMSMRLAFSISTALEAEIILLDEWLSVGDAEFSEKSDARLSRLINKSKILVLASHNQDLIKKQCNKIVDLRDGHVLPPNNA